MDNKNIYGASDHIFHSYQAQLQYPISFQCAAFNRLFECRLQSSQLTVGLSKN